MTTFFSTWFAYPQVFWFTPFLFLALFASGWGWGQRRRALVALGEATALQKLLFVDSRSQRWRRVCLFLGLLLLLLGSAGPQWGLDYSPQTQQGPEIMLVLDVSRSMLAEQPSRLGRALYSLRDLADHFQRHGGRRLALVVFAGHPHLVFPLTRDLDHFRFALSQIENLDFPPSLRLQPDDPATSGTRLGAALTLAVQSFPPAGSAPHHVLLLSDGDDPARDEEWLQGVHEARAVQVPIHVVGIGDPEQDSSIVINGAVLQFEGKTVRTRLQEKILQEIARRTGGIYIPAHQNNLPLGSLFEMVLSNRIQEPGTGIQEAAIPIFQQRYAWFLWPALVLLAASLFIRTNLPEEKRKSRHPRRSQPEDLSSFPRSSSLAAVSWMLIILVIFLIGAAPPENDLIRAGNAAFRQGENDLALSFFEKAEITTADPGLVAFNKAAVYYRLAKFREAELHYRRCLEDDQAPDLRRAQAFFGLGTAIMRQAGEKDRPAIERAIEAFTSCLAVREIPPELATDAQYNLELARLLWLRAQPAQEPSSPDRQPNGDPKQTKQKSPMTGNEDPKQSTTQVPIEGDPEKGKLGKQPNGRQSPSKRSSPGPLHLLPDDATLLPLPAEDSAAYLEQLEERILHERRTHVRQSTPVLPHVKDW